jgi:NADH dehydrogenase [ubiquinone] 1 alpha subcomplex assembly factor 7
MLKQKIIKLLKEQGAIPFDKFMNLSLSDKENGYYRINNPIGLHADFTTSPEISQVFGELIGLWLLDVWIKLGSPKKCYLVELGAGRGTLMLDILRATKSIKQFHDSLQIEIIEINKELIELQQKQLNNYSNISWKSSVDELQIDAPVLIYSNEFFDALPVKQYFFKDKRCFELMVSLDENEELKLNFIENEPFNLLDVLAKDIKDYGEEYIYESSPVANSIFHYLGNIIKKNKGVILTIDYGYIKSTLQNTIRGFKNHEVLSIFDIITQPGNVDFTYNVNFRELLLSVESLKIDTYTIISQKEFLENLGIQERTNILLKNINNEIEKESFLKRIETLISPSEMGEKFKVMCVSFGLEEVETFKKLMLIHHKK